MPFRRKQPRLHNKAAAPEAALEAQAPAAVTQGGEEPCNRAAAPEPRLLRPPSKTAESCMTARRASESARPKAPACGSGEGTGTDSALQDQVAIPEEERKAAKQDSSSYYGAQVPARA